jgi:Mg-chelatase subunit ChlD
MQDRSSERRAWSASGERERGAALILLTTMLTTVLLPLVGLAIDGSIQYLIKTKLSASVDAAALAGARSLSTGLDLASQTAAAVDTVERFFAANFPQGYWRTANAQVDVAVAETAQKTRTVTVRASVETPLYFMRVLGHSSGTLAVEGRASRRDVNVVLVLDRSGSLTTAGACDDLRNAARSFVDSFAEGRDRLGMITYGGGSRVDFEPSLTFKTANPTPLSTMINSIACNGATGSAQAISEAYNQVVEINEPGSLNVILFFTDGQPNAITAAFPVKKLTTSYSPTGKSTCRDSAGRSNTHALWNPGPKTGFMNTSGSGVRGVRPELGPPIPVSADPNAISDSNGCYFAGDIDNVHRDIAHLPDADLYNNSIWGYKTVNSYASGPYMGKARVEASALENASINALDNAATRIRADANFDVVIYAIGLGGAGQAEHILMRRVANDLQSPIFNPDRPVGLYVFAPTPAQLNDAFYRIASEILRLAL